jgi:hypothetical protein
MIDDMPPDARRTLRILGVAGSLRRGSHNRALLRPRPASPPS